MGCMGMFANIQELNNFLQTSVVFILVFWLWDHVQKIQEFRSCLQTFGYFILVFFILGFNDEITYCLPNMPKKYRNEKRQYVSKIQLDSPLGKMKNTRMKMGRFFKYCVFFGFSRHLISLFCQVAQSSKT